MTTAVKQGGWKWRKIKLTKVTTKIGSGATPHGGKSAYKKSGISLIRSLNVFDLKLKKKGLAFIGEAQAKNLSNVIVEENDILLNITGASVCRCAIMSDDILPARVNQHVAIVRADKKKLSPKFLLYSLVLGYNKQRLLGIASNGATREALTKSDIENFEITIPSLPAQQKIASALSAFDDLIAINERRIQVLEETAWLIYHEWFVKFRFPGYKKTRFIESRTKFGKIPKGWEVKPFSELVEINPTIKTIKSEPHFFVAMDGVSTGSFVKIGGEKIVKNGRRFANKDVLFARITPCLENGKGGYVILDKESQNEIIFGSTEFIIFREKLLPSEFIYLLSRDRDFRKNAEKSMVGASGRQRVQDSCFNSFFVPLPSQNLLANFTQATSPLFENIYNLERENQSLRQARDLLLPRLIGGEIKVGNLNF